MSESGVEFLDPRFGSLVSHHERPLLRHCGGRWFEGPVWFSDLGVLVWSDIPNNRMLARSVNGNVWTFREPSEFTNGNTRDTAGRLVSCSHGARSVLRTEHDGSITVLADSYQGKRLNSPNDAVVDRHGAVWFTDPDYGIRSDYEGHVGAAELDGRYVYRISPSGELSAVATDFDQPNGLAFSPDESILYIADSGAPRHLRKFAVTNTAGTSSAAERSFLSGGEVFAEVEVGVPDGVRVDVLGNVWTTSGAAVICFAPDGTLIGRIAIPEGVANLTFGGPRRTTLFVTATEGLYEIALGVAGAGRC